MSPLLISRTLSNRHWQCQPQVLACLAQTNCPTETLTELAKLYDQNPNTVAAFIEDPEKMKHLTDSRFFLSRWYRLFLAHPNLALDNNLLNPNIIAYYSTSIPWETLNTDQARKLLTCSIPGTVFRFIKNYPMLLEQKNQTDLENLLAAPAMSNSKPAIIS